MEHKFTNFYNELKPNGDIDNFVDNVVKKADNMKQEKLNKFSRKMIVSLAAATVVIMSALGVGAVNNWDYYAAFGGIFGDNAVYMQDYAKAPEYKIIRNTFEDFDFEISGVLGSEDNLMVLIDVKAKNGFEFNDGLLYMLDTRISGWEGSIFNNTLVSMGCSLRTKNETADGFTAMLNISTETKLSGRTLTITVDRVGQREKEIKGELVMTVKIDLENLPTITLTPNKYAAVKMRAYLLPEKYRKKQEIYTDEKFEGNAIETTAVGLPEGGVPLELNYSDTVIFIKNLELTPMSLKIEFERTESEIDDEYFHGGYITPLYLLMVDGEMINLHYDDGGIANGFLSGPMYDNGKVIGYRHVFEFEYPICVDEIISVVIGELEVPMK